MAVPKAETLQWEWADFQQLSNELHAGEEDARPFYEQLALMGMDWELIETAPFCAAAQPTPQTITQADILSGDWKAKLREHLLAYAYWKWCEE